MKNEELKHFVVLRNTNTKALILKETLEIKEQRWIYWQTSKISNSKVF